MSLLPPELLHATLVLEGAPHALRSASLHVEVLGHGYEPETMQAIASPHVEIDVHARLVFDDRGEDLKLLLKLPPAPLGMSLGRRRR